jgi:hypothetical protein
MFKLCRVLQEHGVHDMVPCVREPRDAPVRAVHAVPPRPGVHGRVRVDPELRQRGDVEQRHRRPHGADDAPHHGLLRGQGRPAAAAAAGRLRSFLQRPRLPQAAASRGRCCWHRRRPSLALLLLRRPTTYSIEVCRQDRWSETTEFDPGKFGSCEQHTCRSGSGRRPGRRPWFGRRRRWRRPNAPMWRGPWRRPSACPCPGTCYSRPARSPTCTQIEHGGVWHLCGFLEIYRTVVVNGDHVHLAGAPVGPPVPRVEDEQVRAEPVAGVAHGVQLQHPADVLPHDVHQERGVVEHQ